MTGNAEATRFDCGDLALIILYRLTWPRAYADEVIAFVAQNGVRHRVYAREDIAVAEQLAGFSMKRGSTTAQQALFAQHLQRRANFWTQPFPLGVANIAMLLLLDADEAGFTVCRINRGRGKARVGFRVRQPGPYTRGDNWNLIIFVSPCGRRWFRFSQDSTTSEVYQGVVRIASSRASPSSTRPSLCYAVSCTTICLVI